MTAGGWEEGKDVQDGGQPCSGQRSRRPQSSSPLPPIPLLLFSFVKWGCNTSQVCRGDETRCKVAVDPLCDWWMLGRLFPQCDLSLDS